MSDDIQDGGEDFAAMLEQYGDAKPLRLSVGDRVSAKVIHLTKDTVFFQLSHADEAFMPRVALGEREVEIGDTIDAMVVSTRDGIELGLKLGRDLASLDMLEQARAGKVPVEGTVTAVNKGGLEVKVGSVSAFCPLGQIDLGFVDEPDKLIGKTKQFLVRELREGGRSVVLSRRALLEAERREKAAALRDKLAVGQRLTGKVSRVADFGLFVDLGGVDGLVPMSELSHARVDDPRRIAREGDEVTVQLLRIEDDPKRPGQQRIALSIKATQPDPFDAVAGSLQVSSIVEGRVVKLEPFGAFVEIAPGVQGLVHVSELSYKRVRHPGDVLEVGREVAVRVLAVDHDKKRISLSLRQAGGKDEAAAAAASREPSPRELARREAAEERAIVDDYKASGGTGGGLGTLGDLLKRKTKGGK